jgi:hypothetical protein
MKADEQAGRSSGLIKSSFIGIRVTQNVRSAPLRAGAYEVERRAGGAALSLRDGVVSVSAAKWPSATIATGITAILAGGEHSGKRGRQKVGGGGYRYSARSCLAGGATTGDTPEAGLRGGTVTFQPAVFPHGHSAGRVEAVSGFCCHHGA